MELELLSNIEKKYTSELISAMSEVQQSRSNFQIDNFVVGQHDTPQMQYYQTILELQELYYTIKIVDLQIKRTQIEIKKMKEANDEIELINAQIKEIELEKLMITVKGTVRELDRLLQIFNSFDHKYSRQEIEEDQVRYWNKRLQRQVMLEAVAGGSTAQAAHLDSLRQIGLININDDGTVVIPSLNFNEKKQVE